MIAFALRFTDMFVPDSARTTRSDLGRARMFAFTHLFGPALGTSIVFFLSGVDPAPGFQCAVIASCICAFWLLPFVLKFTGNLALVATASIQNLLFVTLFGAYSYGGMASPFLPWLLVALLLGFTYLHDKPLRVVGLFVVNILLFVGVWLLYGPPQERVPLAQLSSVGLISVFSATFYVAWMAIYYGLLLSSASGLEREVDLHRRTATRLLEVKNKAVQANRDKSVFLAKMSHELRTPLNAVIGYSEILLEDAEEVDTDSQRASDLRRINAAGKHLLSLVTDVLDISKIESEQMEIRCQRFALRPLLEGVASTVEPMLRQNRNKLIMEIDVHLGDMTSDDTRLRQILLNLLGNAAKFTEDGVITVAARRPGGPRGKWIEVDVRDTGIGISKEDLASLFRDFSQVAGTRSMRREGTGLGLVLSQKLCAMLGGGILVQSEPEQGSCFSIRIPADVQPVNTASDNRDAVTGSALPVEVAA